MEVINLVFLVCGETLFPAWNVHRRACFANAENVACCCRVQALYLQIVNFPEMKKISSVFKIYIQYICISVTLLYPRLWPDNSAYAAEHDRVTNGSKILQTQQYPLVYNTNLTISGHSSIDFEVSACSFLSVHQIQCWHGTEREKTGKKERRRGKEEEKGLQQSWAFKSIETATIFTESLHQIDIYTSRVVPAYLLSVFLGHGSTRTFYFLDSLPSVTPPLEWKQRVIVTGPVTIMSRAKIGP